MVIQSKPDPSLPCEGAGTARLTPRLPRPIGSGAVYGPLHGVKKVDGSKQNTSCRTGGT